MNIPIVWYRLQSCLTTSQINMQSLKSIELFQYACIKDQSFTLQTASNYRKASLLDESDISSYCVVFCYYLKAEAFIQIRNVAQQILTVFL